jgi:histidine triad (HIT) family protein
VIPKNHYLNIESIPVEELNKIIEVVKLVATLIHNRLNIDGYNILQNNFRAAGQVVNHFHFHIIPRRLNDEKFKLYIPREQAPEESLDGILALLKNDNFYSK